MRTICHIMTIVDLARPMSSGIGSLDSLLVLTVCMLLHESGNRFIVNTPCESDLHNDLTHPR